MPEALTGVAGWLTPSRFSLVGVLLLWQKVSHLETRMDRLETKVDRLEAKLDQISYCFRPKHRTSKATPPTSHRRPQIMTT